MKQCQILLCHPRASWSTLRSLGAAVLRKLDPGIHCSARQMMKWIPAFAGMTIICGILLPLTAHAADDVVPTISVTGYAEDKIAPDKAVISVQVYSENKKLDVAKSEQDKKVKQLVSIAGSNGVKSSDIQTQFANVQPQYDYVRQPDKTSKQVFRAYVLTNTIQVNVRDIDKVGPIVDALVSGKFDRINNVSFGLENRRLHEEKLLTEALKHAKQKAKMMANALDAGIGKPLTISESGSYNPPVLMRNKAVAMAAPMAEDAGSMSTYTPEGVIEIQKTVNVTFELQ